jgi:hypothetical protein
MIPKGMRLGPKPGTSRAAMSAVASALLASCCGGDYGPSSCPEGQVHYPPSLYSDGYCAAPQTACTSWAFWLAPAPPPAGEPALVIDRSVSPARADLKLGARMQAGLVGGQSEPRGCAAPFRFELFSFRTSDPGILRLSEAVPTYSARFLAVAPGVARVLADGPTLDGRPAELSICADPSVFDDKSCAKAPLVIRVVP